MSEENVKPAEPQSIITPAYLKRLALRKIQRKSRGNVARHIWDPEKEVSVTIDDIVAYKALRQKIAEEMRDGAYASRLCKKYRISSSRLGLICVEHKVKNTHKPGEGGHRELVDPQLLAALKADAAAGMVLQEMRRKWPHHDVRAILLKRGVKIQLQRHRRSVPATTPGGGVPGNPSSMTVSEVRVAGAVEEIGARQSERTVTADQVENAR